MGRRDNVLIVSKAKANVKIGEFDQWFFEYGTSIFLE